MTRKVVLSSAALMIALCGSALAQSPPFDAIAQKEYTALCEWHWWACKKLSELAGEMGPKPWPGREVAKFCRKLNGYEKYVWQRILEMQIDAEFRAGSKTRFDSEKERQIMACELAEKTWPR